MANIPIYNTNHTFSIGSTPFGFYDSDPVFRADADKATKWCAIRLGWPIEAIELDSGSFYTAFEESITVYGNEVYKWKIRENYISMEGSSNTIALNDTAINPSLSTIINLAKNYGAEAGSGGNITYYTGSLIMSEGKQRYNLNDWALASASLTPGDSIEIKRIFYESPPAIVKYFDPWTGIGSNSQTLLESFGMGSFSPAITFMLMPLYFDVQKIQAIELNDQIRRSSYSFELVNNNLTIFPIPTRDSILRFTYIKLSERNSINRVSGTDIISNVSNVPYNNPVYSQINSIGKQWIYQYMLAIAKEMLGYVRGKYTTIPVPGSEVTLNSNDLLSDARNEKDKLLEDLRAMLEDVSRTKQLEKRTMEDDSVNKTLSQIPLPLYIG